MTPAQNRETKEWSALVDDFRTFVSCADVDLTASVIWRDSIAAQVPDQNSRMSWRKAAPRLTWTLPLA